MSGCTGVSLAEQFRYTANERNAEKWHVHFGELYNRIIASAKSIADEGRYEYCLFDSRLQEQQLLSQLIRVLRSQGFKVETGSTGGHHILVSWRKNV